MVEPVSPKNPFDPDRLEKGPIYWAPQRGRRPWRQREPGWRLFLAPPTTTVRLRRPRKTPNASFFFAWRNVALRARLQPRPSAAFAAR